MTWLERVIKLYEIYEKTIKNKLIKMYIDIK